MSKLSHCTTSGVKFIQVLKLMSSMLQKKNSKVHKEFIKQLGPCLYDPPLLIRDGIQGVLILMY